MWRALVFVALLALAAYGAVWLADRPGDVMITYGTYRIQTTVAVALVLTVGTGFLLAVLWGGVGFLLNLPSRWSYATRARRRARGYAARCRTRGGAGGPMPHAGGGGRAATRPCRGAWWRSGPAIRSPRAATPTRPNASWAGS